MASERRLMKKEQESRKGKGARLGTRLRGDLAEAYAARGHHISNLWFVYSPKARRDFVLRSSLEYGHFLLVESDVSIVKVDYSPAKRVAMLAGEAFGTIVDAEVTLANGQVVWREVKNSSDLVAGEQTRANLQILIQAQAATDAGVRHEVITEKVIYAIPQQINNWHRVLAWLAQAREWALHDYGNQVAALLHRRRRVELEEVAALGTPEEVGLYFAALFQAVQRGQFCSDLHSAPLSLRSQFWLTEEGVGR